MRLPQAARRTAHSSESRGRSDLEPIEQSANSDSVDVILQRWRAIERQLDGLQPGSPEAMRLFEEFERARDDYMAAFRERKDEHGDPH